MALMMCQVTMRLLNEYGFDDFGFVSCCDACDGITVVLYMFFPFKYWYSLGSNVVL